MKSTKKYLYFKETEEFNDSDNSLAEGGAEVGTGSDIGTSDGLDEVKDEQHKNKIGEKTKKGIKTKYCSRMMECIPTPSGIQVHSRKKVQTSMYTAEEELIRKSSCLSGVLFSNNIDETLKVRRPLLEPKRGSKIQFSNPTIIERSLDKYIEGNTARKVFLKTLEMKGMGVDISVKVGGFGFSGGAGHSYESSNDDNQYSESHSQAVSYSKFTVSCIPLKRFQLSNSDILFSQDAFDELINIQNLLGEREIMKAQTACKSFFENFGTHVYLGDVHLGGMFVLETRYEGSSFKDKQTIQEMVEKTHTGHVNASLGEFGALKIEEHYKSASSKHKGKSKESKTKYVTTQCTKIGGPPGVDDIKKWKEGLVSDSSTWCVISGGKLDQKEYTGVWDLVQKLPKGFDDVEKLSSFLKSEALGKIPDKREEFQTNVDILYKGFQSIKETQDYTNIIDELLCMLTESSFPTYFLEEVLQKSPKMSDILNHATNLNSKESEVARCAKAMKHILGIIEGIDFDGKEAVVRWTTQNNSIKEKTPEIESAHDLKIWLENLDRYCQQNKGLGEVARSTAIAKSVLSTREKFKKSRQEEYILMLALLIPHGYSMDENVFASMINTADVKHLVQRGKYYMNHVDSQTDRTKRFAVVCSYMIQNCLGREDLWQNHFILLKDISVPNPIHKILHACSNTYQIKMQLERLLADNSSTISWNFFESEDEILQVTVETDRQENASLQSKGDEKFEKICAVFSLKEYFPAKITLQIVQTKSIDIKAKPNEASDIPWAILADALSSNNNFRENILEAFKNTVTQRQTSSKPRNLIERRKFRDHAGLGSDCKDYIKKLAPADLLLAIFLCCNMELRKVLVEKMHQCKFAIPFVYVSNKRINVSLWPLREIQIDSYIESVANRELPVVSFVRIGDVNFPISKSKQINALLRGHNEEYNTFSHKDCPSGSIKRTVANGMIEVSWFVPSSLQGLVQDDTNRKEVSSLANTSVAFCNLRGDASIHNEQLQYLSHISSVLVVLVDEDSLTDEHYRDIFHEVYNGKHHTIVQTNLKTTEDDSMSKLDKHSTMYQVEKMDEESGNESLVLTIYNEDDGSLENLSKLKLKMTEELSSLLENLTKRWSFETIPEFLHSIAVVDEDTPKCALGKKLASEVLKSIQCSEHKKQSIVPLQGSSLWQKISKLEKKRHSSHLQNINEGESFLKEFNQLRQSQVQACNKAPSTVALFVKTLYMYGSDAITTYFILSYLSQGMNMISSKEMRENRSERGNEKRRSEMNDSEIDLSAVSFGLEHLFREIGQIYEAFCSCRDDLKLSLSYRTQHIINALPVLAAKTFIHGHTFEIMDGDASNVQQKWVSAVLSELHKLVGESKITSISVLGIQSSGKSTLLNTMFGLKFSVSAGRCTRGIYAQLLPVESGTSKIPCDYLLVLDTEGLRSTEEGFMTYNHDNELSTFVVGLADIILINVKGETIAELENVLQIVAYAFVRFKQKNTDLKLPQTALMVHQNVPANDAMQKLAEGNKQLVKRLDRITKEVAIQERVTHISSFSDVINFNHIRDVVYIPDLWLGRPPMSPISLHYSEAVVKLKENIIRILQPKKPSMTMKYFRQHIEHLWERIISESLVFSFQNCLQVKAIRLLDARCQAEVSNLETEVSKWYNDHTCQNFSACNGEFETTERRLKNEMKTVAKSMAMKSKQDIETFIENSNFKDQMIDWKLNRLEKFTVSKDKIVEDYAAKIEKEKCRIILDIKGEGLYEEKKKEITLYAKEIAGQLQGSEVDIDKEFVDMWSNCIHKIQKEENETTKIDNVGEVMIYDMQSVLDEIYIGETFLREIITFHEDPCNISQLHGSFDKQGEEGSRWFKSMYKNLVQGVWQRFGSTNKNPSPKYKVDLLFKQLDDEFEDLSKRDIAPSIPEFRKIVNLTKQMFDETASQSKNHEHVYSKEDESKIYRHVFRFALKKFIELNDKYRERHSLVRKLQSFKPSARKLFQAVVEKTSDEIIVASIISQDLEAIIQHRIDSQIAHELIVHVKETCGQKFELIIKILEELGDNVCKDKERAFSDLKDYSSSPAKYAQRWLRIYAEKYYFGTNEGKEKSEYQMFTSRTAATTIKDIKKCIDCARGIGIQADLTQSNAAKGIDNPETELKEWTNHFREQLRNKKLIIFEHTFRSAYQGYSITISDDFIQNLREKVDELSEKLREEYDKSGISDITWTDESPFEKLFKNVWGCTEQCPLCGEPCHKTDPNHFSDNAADCHSCIQHKPSGIDGTRYVGSSKLAVESCNFDIQSTNILKCGSWCKCDSPECRIYHPYREYKTYMPEWNIEPSATMTNCKYWMWIITEYRKELAAHYGVNEPDIPHSWTNIDPKTAKLNLRQCYGVEN